MTMNTPPIYADVRERWQRATPEEVQQLIAFLKSLPSYRGEATTEPIRVITVRVPRSLHRLLVSEAHERKTSLNKLCLAKLLRPLPDDTE